jgi:RNA polymerase sigma-70 factor (ECF subfamily)
MDAFRRARPAEPLAAEEPAAKAEEQDPRLEAMSLAIAALEPNFRQILQLRLHDELSYDEIAETLRIPVGTVRSRLHHAVKMLSASMRKDPNL